MIGTVNPFSDPEFKKQILGKEGRAVDDPGDYEILQPEEDVSKNLKKYYRVSSSTP